MSESGRYHVSSAIVAAVPERVDEVLDAIASMPGVDVHAHEGGRIVVTIEGYSTGELGDRLTGIGLLDGVFAANMVFEHAEEEKST